MLQRFPVVLTQVKAENTSHNLLNEMSEWNNCWNEIVFHYIKKNKL